MQNLRQGCAAFFIFYQRCLQHSGRKGALEANPAALGVEHEATTLTSCQFVTGPRSATTTNNSLNAHSNLVTANRNGSVSGMWEKSGETGKSPQPSRK